MYNEFKLRDFSLRRIKNKNSIFGGFMKIKTKPIAMAGLAAVCAATLVTGAALIGNN